MVIGLPKGLYYYEHFNFWKCFFNELGIKTKVSEDTNKKILDSGVNSCLNELCLPVKVFHGHVVSLADEVDYIFIPRYISFDKNEYSCPKFCGLPDMILLNLNKKVKVIEVIIHDDLFPELTYKSLKELSNIINIKYKNIVKAYKTAKDKANDNKNFYDYSIGKRKILVLGHSYMIHDSFLSMNLINKIKENNFFVYTPLELNKTVKRRYAYPFIDDVFWNSGFEVLGSAFYLCEKGSIDAVIYLTPFACGVDSFVTDFIERHIRNKYKIPFLKLTIDEHTGEAAFDTRIEAFIEMVKI